MSRAVTLAAVLPEAGHELYWLSQRFGLQTVEAACAHHKARNLRADVAKGTTADRDGNRSRFVSWSEEDAARYEGMPGWVFHDFFRGDIANSCSRIERGLNP